MGLRIGTNVASLVAQRHLRATTLRIEANFRRLASGKRIESSADDAAGVLIASRMQAELRSLEQAKRNAQDGISLAQIGEGGLASIGDVLQRARELAVQAGNGTLSGQDKDALQAELVQIRAQIDQIAGSTRYNGLDLLNGTFGSVTLFIGTGRIPGGSDFLVTLDSATTAALGLGAIDIGASGSPAAAITAIDAAIDDVAAGRARLGATMNHLDGSISSIDVSIENLAAAKSRIEDVDLAIETADLAKNQILQQAGLAVLSQANLQPKLALRLLEALLP